MPDSLNVIALISGGKDSFYSILHCIQNGHRVTALANLHPASLDNGGDDADGTASTDESEDLDSFMYQTVGHSVIPLYAKALQLPLHRKAITGTAVQTSRDYAYHSSTVGLEAPSAPISPDRQQDETEDLVPLLREIIGKHPEVNALSTGAIQSTYQRTRIESVALRLGLVPLGYLWQYPILPRPLGCEDSLTSLLDDMHASGCKSRIIKIASGGIRESLLWSDVSSPKTGRQLIQGLSRFFDNDELGLRGAVLGEGGEFESLAMSGPRSVWKGGEIVVDDGDWTTAIGYGGASYVRIKRARVVPHERTGIEQEAPLVRQPMLLDQHFQAVQKFVKNALPAMSSLSIENSTIADPSASNTYAPARQQSLHPRLSYTSTTSTIHIANITHLSLSGLEAPGNDLVEPPSTVPSQITTIVTHIIPTLLKQISTEYLISPRLDSPSITSTTLLLSSISDFAVINPIYSNLFDPSIPNPPSRVTFATSLSDDIKVMMSITLDRGPREERRGLHVQGRSYWAPANIGPYSQAIAVPLRMPLGSKNMGDHHSQQDEIEETDDSDDKINFEIVHMAGQIPLVPSSMDLFQAPFEEQAILSLQHLWRVGQERKVDHWTAGVALLAHIPHSLSGASNTQNDQDPSIGADTTTDLYRRAIIASEVWRHTHLVPAQGRIATAAHHANSAEEDDQDEEVIDIWDLQHNPRYKSHARPSHSHVYQPLPNKEHFTPPPHHHALPGHNLAIHSSHPSSHPISNAPTTNTPRDQVFVPPFLAASVTALPRTAEVEWCSTGITGLASLHNDTIPTGSGRTRATGGAESGSGSGSGRASWIEGENWRGIMLSRTPVHVTNAYNGNSDGEGAGGPSTSFITLLVPRPSSPSCLYNETTLSSLADSILSYALFKRSQPTLSGTAYLPLDSPVHLTDPSPGAAALSVIPCHDLWGRLGGEVVVTAGDSGVVELDESGGVGSGRSGLVRVDAALVVRVDCEG